MSDVKISLKWNEDIYMKGAKAAYDIQMKHGGRRYIGWFFIALFQFGVVGALRAQSFGLLLFSTFLLIYWYYFRWLVRKPLLEKAYENSPYRDRTLEITLEEEGICINGACTPWREFESAVSTKEGYLLDLKKGFLYIPKNIFESDEDRAEFHSILKRELKSLENY